MVKHYLGTITIRETFILWQENYLTPPRKNITLLRSGVLSQTAATTVTPQRFQ
jgi:hypothetical protein